MTREFLSRRRSVCRGFLIIVLMAATSCSVLKPPRRTAYVYYPIKQGDTLSSVSNRFGISASDLQLINNISDVRTLQVGSVVKVPLDQIAVSGRKKGNGTPRVLPSAKAAANSGTKKIDKVKLSTVEERYIGRLGWPVPGKKVTSKFGWRWFKFHEGIDIKAPEGTPILAAHDGQVVHSGQGIRGYGNIIVLKTYGMLTVYAHNKRNLVRVGQSVRRGQKIAYVGSTGKSTGPHLHFETRVRANSKRNVAVNPLTFFKG